MLAKNLTFLAKADAAGIVLGARVPIILTSRADSVRTRMASCAVAVLYAACAPRARPRCRRRDRDGHDPRRQRRLLEPQVPGLRDRAAGELERLIKGQIDGIGARPRLRADGGRRDAADRPGLRAGATCPTCRPRSRSAGAWLRETQKLEPIAVGHRVVHGGPDYDRPVLVDDEVLAELERYVPLAPLHQPNNLAPIRSLLRASPGPAAGRLLRHRLPPRPRRAGGPLRASRSASTPRACAATASTACPTNTSPSRLPEVAPDDRRRPGDRRPPRQRRLDVRARGRPQRREHDGLHRARRPADGHAAGPARSRRRALPDRARRA